jgi:hypothetical protein
LAAKCADRARLPFFHVSVALPDDDDAAVAAMVDLGLPLLSSLGLRLLAVAEDKIDFNPDCEDSSLVDPDPEMFFSLLGLVGVFCLLCS